MYAFTVAVAATCTAAAALALAPGTARAASVTGAVRLARPAVSRVAIPGGSDPRDLTAMRGTLFFTAWTRGHGRQLWKTNGTAAGTIMLTHVPGRVGADPEDLTVADGVLFFSAHDSKHGRELWKSNGTVTGTTMVRDIVPGPLGSNPQDITYAVGQQQTKPHNQVLVYFSASTAASGPQLWKSNGTAAGTVMLTDVNPGPAAGLRPEDITPVSGTDAAFSGDDGVHGRELWVTSGTPARTAMYEDLNPGPAGSDPANIMPEFYGVDGLQLSVWYFAANDGTHGRELFVAYDGDPPAEVFDINPGRASSNPGVFDAVDEETGLIAATTATGGRELFEVQGPPAPPITSGPQPGTATEVPGVGTGKGSDPELAATSQIGIPQPSLPRVAARTYFAADLAGHGRQLWQADEVIGAGPGLTGTLNFRVASVRPVDVINPAGADPRDLTSVGGTPVLGRLGPGATIAATEVFSAYDRSHGRQLWYSDGWSSNTRRATGMGPGWASPEDITVAGQTAYFTAFDRAHGRELWKLTVPPAPQMFLAGPAAPVTTGSAVTLTATMEPAPGARQPSGSVTFYEDGTKIGSTSLKPHKSGEPTASLTTTARSGNHQIVAVYSGDSHYMPATSDTSLVTGD